MSHTLKRSFFEFEGMEVGYYAGGEGEPLMMIHGSGPGASSLGNWSRVLDDLSQRYRIYAMDLIGFGISSRKPAPPYFDFGMWVRQAKTMLDLIDAPQIGVIGHSLSAAIALQLASADRRISAVLTTGAIGAPFSISDATRRIWRCPENRVELVAALSTLIHDTSIIDDDYIAAREPVVFAQGYADYFNSMFSGDPRQYVEQTTLSEQTLSAINCPVIMLHGREDVPFPPDTSEVLAKKIKQADLYILHGCSHSVAFERSRSFLSAVNQLFS